MSLGIIWVGTSLADDSCRSFSFYVPVPSITITHLQIASKAFTLPLVPRLRLRILLTNVSTSLGTEVLKHTRFISHLMNRPCFDRIMHAFPPVRIALLGSPTYRPSFDMLSHNVLDPKYTVLLNTYHLAPRNCHHTPQHLTYSGQPCYIS